MIVPRSNKKRSIDSANSLNNSRDDKAMTEIEHTNSLEGIAIIGMTGRFPKAKDLHQYWQNLRDGVESITFFTDQELEALGIPPALIRDPNYVKAGSFMDDIDLFDASFFGYSPREAETIDPQQRIFLECAWEAVELAGYSTGSSQNLTGVFAGVGPNVYLLENLYPQRESAEAAAYLQSWIGTDKDYLTTRVSYLLNLRGPSITVQTACSTSLVAISLACQNLMGYQCDLALAGGVSIAPNRSGYLSKGDGMLSPDGHCRAFDASAQGFVGGDGVGVVVLKRLPDALADGDTIHAVIRGWAVNNDGAMKVGYTAPSVDAQADVIAMAQAFSGVHAETITYLETHGTGTSLGDPIEIAALTKAFGLHTQKRNYCAIGSVKTNMGHLDAAAGVAGLIKTVLAMKNRQIPPSLHFNQPNSKIDFANSPFYVNTQLAQWQPATHLPLRAGVSSFGMGGTNAHLVVEEAPHAKPGSPSRPWQLLLMSAKTETALDATTTNMVRYFEQSSEGSLADAAFTLQTGRQRFTHRRVVICSQVADALAALEGRLPRRVFSAFEENRQRDVVFLFPGQGAQQVRMAQGLYESEPFFREQLDECIDILKKRMNIDLREILYPTEGQEETAAKLLEQTSLAQPALFAIEYALARMWIFWGIKPQAMLGHSLGEYVAACLANVFTLEDGLMLVAERGRLMQSLPTGAMLAMSISEADAQAWLSPEISLAAVNGPKQCVFSGEVNAIDILEKQLNKKGMIGHRLSTSHAFHSPMMEPAVEQFIHVVNRVKLNAPTLSVLSGLTGTWLTAQEATSVEYWGNQMRKTVRFADGVKELAKQVDPVLLEVGPGRTLISLVKQQTTGRMLLATLKHERDERSDGECLMSALGQLWVAGVEVDWKNYYHGEQRKHIPLPTYPFERERFWIDRPQGTVKSKAQPVAFSEKAPLEDWFYVPYWKPSVRSGSFQSEELLKRQAHWLVFIDDCPLGEQILADLTQAGHKVTIIRPGDCFKQQDESTFTIAPAQEGDYLELVKSLYETKRPIQKVLHLWNMNSNMKHSQNLPSSEKLIELGFQSLLFLCRALLIHAKNSPIQIWALSTGIHTVTGSETILPEKAAMLAVCKVISQEYPGLICRSIDLQEADLSTHSLDKWARRLVKEFFTDTPDVIIAYRGNTRWIQAYDPVHLDDNRESGVKLQNKGVYVILGGLGKIGLAMAEFLARQEKVRLVLIGRSLFPDQAEWDQWFASHLDQTDVHAKIERLQAIQKIGSEIIVLNADISDEGQLGNVISRITTEFGKINGVIHAAGSLDEDVFRFIRNGPIDLWKKRLLTKINGLYGLEKSLAGQKFDFFILFSSISSILAGHGHAGYAAENLLADSFANRVNQNQAVVPWTVINWDAWEFGDRNIEWESLDGLLSETAMTPDEGIKSFHHIISFESPSQIIVSPRNLQIRSEQWLQSKPSVASEQVLAKETAPLYARPVLSSTYVASTNDIEQAVVQVWQEILGIEMIGIQDNFFELGGHSLLATQIIGRLQQDFRTDLPIRELFDTPTVAGMAAALIKHETVPGRAAAIARLRSQMARMSTEEMKALLQQKKSKAGG
jgi:acyl transferase domain-containing protein/acyl carrier protein